MTSESSPPDAAIVMLDLGEEEDRPLFRGSFVDACKFVWALPPRDRANLHVRSDGVTYYPADLESMRREVKTEI